MQANLSQARSSLAVTGEAAKLAPATAVTAESLSLLLSRLEEVLREENAVLEAKQIVEHEAFVRRKNQLLREIMVLQRCELSSSAVAEVTSHIRRVKTVVERNHSLLKSQVDAMTDITSLLSEVTIAEDSDGTYSPRRG
jgi:flagellar biosynthesis/type III secretory pathway chaperone